MKLYAILAVVLAAPIFAGCADDKAATKGPQMPSRDATDLARSPNAAPLANAPTAASPVETPNLHVSDEIARACNLPQQEYTPSFEYDSAQIGDADRVVLAAIAKCVSEGPLKGRGLALTGRADPRGEDEYNMSLGESRADSVRRYLHDMGVKQDRLRATSRGELDATGTDEAGWARDRRVDIDLVN
jgi:peptidoglycan-associated lipoprotein